MTARLHLEPLEPRFALDAAPAVVALPIVAPPAAVLALPADVAEALGDLTAAEAAPAAEQPPEEAFRDLGRLRLTDTFGGRPTELPRFPASASVPPPPLVEMIIQPTEPPIEAVWTAPEELALCA